MEAWIDEAENRGYSRGISQGISRIMEKQEGFLAEINVYFILNWKYKDFFVCHLFIRKSHPTVCMAGIKIFMANRRKICYTEEGNNAPTMPYGLIGAKLSPCRPFPIDFFQLFQKFLTSSPGLWADEGKSPPDDKAMPGATVFGVAQEERKRRIA